VQCWTHRPDLTTGRAVDLGGKRVAAQKKLHAAQAPRQKEFLRSIGVPDLSPEEMTRRERREA
jgi:hypothetical protein